MSVMEVGITGGPDPDRLEQPEATLLDLTPVPDSCAREGEYAEFIVRLPGGGSIGANT
jgi:hypothetical protein